MRGKDNFTLQRIQVRTIQTDLYSTKNEIHCYSFSLVTLYIATFLYILLPVLSPIMDAIAPLNESRPIELPVKIEYLVNQEEYFAFVYFHITCSMLMGITAFAATDAQFFVFMCHLCGILSIMGYRLEHLPNVESAKVSSPRQRKDACFKYVALSLLNIFYRVFNKGLPIASNVLFRILCLHSAELTLLI